MFLFLKRFGTPQDLPRIIIVDDPGNKKELLKYIWKKALETYDQDDVYVINYDDIPIPVEIEKEDGWKVDTTDHRFYSKINTL